MAATAKRQSPSPLYHTEQIHLARFGQITQSADGAELVKNRLRHTAGLLQFLHRDILLPVHCGLLKRHGGGIAQTADGRERQTDLLKAINTEIVLARAYNTDIGLKHDVNGYLTSITMGRPGLLKNIANMYLMKDGTPFTSQPGWETMQLPDESRNRDGRFAQTVRTPGYKRVDDTAESAPNLAATMTGYQLVKYLTSAKYDSYQASTSDLPLFRAAEVLLNYAEAKAELGTLTQDDIELSINPLRERADVADLSLTEANAHPDPYLASAETGYANVTGDNKGVILEIRRERTVELLMENLRYWDIMRWKEGKRFEKPFTGLYFPGTGSYDLNSDGVDDVCIWSGSKPSTSAATVYELNKDIFLSEGDRGNIIVHTDYVRTWNEERDYLYPIPTDDRVLTQGAITQNPGWKDGLNF